MCFVVRLLEAESIQSIVKFVKLGPTSMYDQSAVPQNLFHLVFFNGYSISGIGLVVFIFMVVVRAEKLVYFF